MNYSDGQEVRVGDVVKSPWSNETIVTSTSDDYINAKDAAGWGRGQLKLLRRASETKCVQCEKPGTPGRHFCGLPEGAPVMITSVAQAIELFGEGSAMANLARDAIWNSGQPFCPTCSASPCDCKREVWGVWCKHGSRDVGWCNGGEAHRRKPAESLAVFMTVPGAGYTYEVRRYAPETPKPAGLTSPAAEAVYGGTQIKPGELTEVRGHKLRLDTAMAAATCEQCGTTWHAYGTSINVGFDCTPRIVNGLPAAPDPYLTGRDREADIYRAQLLRDTFGKQSETAAEAMVNAAIGDESLPLKLRAAMAYVLDGGEERACEILGRRK